MKLIVKAGLLFLYIVLSCSCSSNKVAVPYEKEAMTIIIKGDQQLNLYQGLAHSLYLCTYQLKDPNAFNQLADEKDGVEKLMECSRFDASVAYTKRLVVQPGQSYTD